MEMLAYVIFQTKYCMPCPTTHKCNMNYMSLCLYKHLLPNCIHRSLVPNTALCAECLSSSSLPHDVHVGAAFTLVWTTTVLPSEHPIYVTHSHTHSLTHTLADSPTHSRTQRNVWRTQVSTNGDSHSSYSTVVSKDQHGSRKQWQCKTVAGQSCHKSSSS